jgi:hypothetical protein
MTDGNDLYYLDTTDVLAADDPKRVILECSDDKYIAIHVEVAFRLLEAAGYNVQCPNFLTGEAETKGSLEEYLAVRVVYHGWLMDKAVKDNRVLDTRVHAMRFIQNVERLIHTEAWGQIVRRLRQAGKQKRGKTKVEDPAAVRARYHELRKSLPHKAAVADLMAEFNIKSPKTLLSYGISARDQLR